MKHFAKLMAACALATGLSGAAFAETAKQAAAKALNGFKPVQDNVGKVFKDPMKLVTSFRNFGMNLGEDSQDIVVRWDRSRWLDGDIGRVAILDIEATGFADDSVKGERIRHVLAAGTDGGFLVMASGTQVTCWRGTNKDKWIDGRCS